MSTFWHSYKAEFFKNKHSVFLWIHIVLPITLVIIMTFYRFGKLSNLALFDTFFKIMGLAFPLLAAVLCGLIADQEKQAGHYQIMLGKLPHKTTTFISQLCMLLTMCLGSIFLAILLFMISMKFVLHTCDVNYLLFFKTGCLIFLSVIFLYSLYLTLAYRFGIGACSVVGFAGVIIAAVASTGQGDNIWTFLPWVWPLRFTNFMLLLYYKVANKIPPIQYFYSYTQSRFYTGLIHMTILTICCIVIYIFSFHSLGDRQK